MAKPTPKLPQSLADVRVTAEQVRRHEGEYYQTIISELVHENAMLAATVEQVASRAAEAQAELAALKGVVAELAPAPGPEQPDTADEVTAAA